MPDSPPSALDNLNKAVADLTSTVDSVVVTLGTPHPTDAQVQAAADSINGQTERLNTALNPPPPPPPTP